MSQESHWDTEYKSSKLLTKENKPQTDVVRFVDYLREDSKVEIDGKLVLDLGSGTGRNSFYFATLGAHVIGLEFSKTAVQIAEKNAHGQNLDVQYIKQSIGSTFPVETDSCDIVLDVTSSNSLTVAEREIYLSETHRVLKTGGVFFVKALCKDGDSNAKHLLKHSPGPEADTYVMPGIGIFERVWSRDDFMNTYKKYFNTMYLDKKTSYSRMNSRVYKRNFWIAYLEKK